MEHFYNQTIRQCTTKLYNVTPKTVKYPRTLNLLYLQWDTTENLTMSLFANVKQNGPTNYTLQNTLNNILQLKFAQLFDPLNHTPSEVL